MGIGERETHEIRKANHMSSYGGNSSPSQSKHRRTSRYLATLNTADDTAYASGRALRPHLDDDDDEDALGPLPAVNESGQTLSERTCRARSGRA